MKSQEKPAMTAQCKTCIFREGGLPLAPGRLGEIMAYLIRGTPHVCHTNARRACRGGRDYQLEIWYRLGIIAAPTDDALAEARAAVLNGCAP